MSMHLILTAKIDLREPSAASGFVTWFDAEVRADEAGSAARVGTARVARIHVGEIVDAGESVERFLVENPQLADLFDVYFDPEGGFRERFLQAAGSDLLYFEPVTLELGWQGKNVELALVRRLADSLGGGCELAVLISRTPAETDQWQRMGFQSSAPGTARAYLHLQLAFRQARIVEVDGTFKVVPNPVEGATTH